MQMHPFFSYPRPQTVLKEFPEAGKAQNMTDDRKQRLKALAARAGRTKKPANDEESGTTEDKSAKPNISFRNYAPTDKSLSSRQEQSGPDDGESMEPSASKRQRTQDVDTAQSSSLEKVTPVSSSKALQNALEEAKRDPIAAATSASTARSTNPNATASVATMAPKKINWDLKRDISDKLAKLEKRTQKAIVRILKERLEREAANAVDEDGSDGGDASDLD